MQQNCKTVKVTLFDKFLKKKQWTFLKPFLLLLRNFLLQIVPISLPLPAWKLYIHAPFVPKDPGNPEKKKPLKLATPEKGGLRNQIKNLIKSRHIFAKG